MEILQAGSIPSYAQHAKSTKSNFALAYFYTVLPS